MRFPDLLVDERALPKYDALLQSRATLLHDCVDFLIDTWTVLAARLADIDCPSHATALMQCRNVIELLDGIEVLIRQGSSFNCFHLLRSAMEAHWGLLWVIAEDTERRGKAYQVGHAHRAIEFASRLDRRAQKNEELRKALQGQHHVHLLDSDSVDAAAVLAKKAEMLSRPEYAEVEQAWQMAVAERRKKGRPGPPPWYSLFDGPKSIRALAYKVKEGFAYETLYALHSDSVHANNAFDHMAPAPDGEEKPVRPIRHPEWLTKATSHAANIAVAISQRILIQYAPDTAEGFGERYVATLRPRILNLLDNANSDPRWP